MENDVRVRFAPSPTGYLHIGNARTALFNWLFARHNRGKFILRIEDTDRERSTRESEQIVLKSLKWLGINWDEGPGVDGDYGPYRQSERWGIYRDYAEKLLDDQLAYRCYCLPEELEETRKSCLARGKMPKYDGRCRELTRKERTRFENEGRIPTIRFEVREGRVVVNDSLRGEIVFESDTIGDFIIIRSDGTAAYNFAVVIDDFLMKISHVIRGEDHLSNTPRQILLYRAFNFALPQFLHHSLILGPDKTKLSKRHGVTSVEQFKNSGFLSDAVVNYLSFLGGALGEGGEIFSPEEIVDRFSIEQVGKSAAIFDFEKLKWMNKAHINRLELNELTGLIIPFIEKAGYHTTDKKIGWLTDVVDLTRERLRTLDQIGEEVGIFFQEESEFGPDAVEVLKNEGVLNLLELLKQEINIEQDIPEESYRNIMLRIKKKTKLKGKRLFMPVRVVLTGRTKGPEMEKIFPLMEKEAVLKRIDMGLKLLAR